MIHHQQEAALVEEGAEVLEGDGANAEEVVEIEVEVAEHSVFVDKSI